MAATDRRFRVPASEVTAVAQARPPERPLRIVEYTDPYSIWCWGCEPSLRRFDLLFADSVEIDVRMGGLFEDFTPMRDWWIRMSGGQWKESVLAFMRAVADQHRMPMNPERMLADIDDFRSTWPACIAVKAAELQGRASGRAYLRRLREAVLIEGRAIHRESVQREVASEVGLDGRQFAVALDDGTAERAFRDDLERCRDRGVKGFPTFELEGVEVSFRIEGWLPWEVFEENLLKLAPALRPRRIEATEDAVVALLHRPPRWATREVAAVLGSTDDETELLLEELESRGTVRRVDAGTGPMWELARGPPARAQLTDAEPVGSHTG